MESFKPLVVVRRVVSILVVLATAGIIIRTRGQGTAFRSQSSAKDATKQTYPTAPPQPQPQPVLCSRARIRQGTWQEVTLPKPPFVRQEKHHTMKCYPENAARLKEEPPSWQTWDWLPHNIDDAQNSCEWTRWSSESFCDVAANKTIAIVGDSLSFEHFVSLLFSMGGYIGEFAQLQSQRKRTNIAKTVCNDTVTLVFRRNDNLSQLVKALKQSKPDVLVLNRGAHWAGDEALLRDMKKTVEQVEKWLQVDCPKWNQDCLAIWRTTVPGHVGCTEFKQPWNGTLEEMEARVQDRSLYNNATWRFRWQNFKRQNELVVDLWKNTTSASNVQIMDAYEINILRPDAHLGQYNKKDCLHSCHPGKVDVYNTLLLHYLKAQQQNELHILDSDS